MENNKMRQMRWLTIPAILLLVFFTQGAFTAGPFGSVGTPGDNSTVRGTIPVSGWVLDDVKVSSVKIYRKDGGSLVYLGDGNLVAGARPDIAAAYPQYPYSNKAGWVFSLVTNFLPDGGNSWYTIHVKATDNDGNRVTLGTRTIRCDNANAVKPFGAFDTMEHGAVISGDYYINWGWVLTPQPNFIPTNGSTINVYLDGVFVGHPVYNVYHSDIAALLPGYANSGGAGGYFAFDTTAYADGVHTIYWIAMDSAGNSDSIGSRYFTIRNGTAVTAPVVTTGAVTVISPAAVSCGGNVTGDGGSAVTARGICWNTGGNPLTTDNKTTNGSGTGSFTGNITALSVGQTYHVRAYATNGIGTSYGKNLTFSTTTAAAGPVVTTTAVSSITSTSANSGGNVTDDGGSAVIARGVCWSTSANPTTADSNTADGTGTGSFSSSMTGLAARTTYHVRAYATNSVGTGYGEDLSFTTASAIDITNPADGASVSGVVIVSAAVAAAELRAADETGGSVTGVEFYIDGDLVKQDSLAPYQYRWVTNLVGNGSHTVMAKAYYSPGQTAEDQVTVNVVNAAGAPYISLNRTRLNFGVVIGDPAAGSQTLLITNSGGGTLNWTASVSEPWISAAPSSGANNVQMEISVDAAGLAVGNYTGAVTITDTNADNSPVSLGIYLSVTTGGGSPPIGNIDTPIDGSTVSGSTAVTGWALDDTEIGSVKLYRSVVSANEPGYVYIADAVFVEGARPDIELKYPAYPWNYKAGWGYMMLTNFLPNNGNGTFVITAIAVDRSGNEVVLGAKTIVCDNENAVKPFGAIDTPPLGGEVSGSSFINWGWALTPRPNTIPTDGSTIRVWVDGMPLAGNPTYNNFRADVAALFPGYNNSGGAGGHYYLDTTLYANGIHTIAWSVSDDAGNADGIGSRYFKILNAAGAHSADRVSFTHGGAAGQGMILPTPVSVKRGYNIDGASRVLFPDDKGTVNIRIKQSQRIEIDLNGPDKENGDNRCWGYLQQGNQQKMLPIGSFLDRARGIFYWQPGPGFRGQFLLVFSRRDSNGRVTKKIVKVEIR